MTCIRCLFSSGLPIYVQSAQGPLAWMAELLSPPGMEQNTASNKNYGSWDYDETTQGKSQSNNDERMARDF